MPVGIALIHAKEVAGEQGRLLAACAGAHFEDCALLIRGVLRQELHFQLPLELFDLRIERTKLLLGKAPHLGVGRRVVDELLQIRPFAHRLAQRVDGGNDRIELGEFAREAHIAFLVGAGRERALHRLPTGDELVEFIGWNGGHSLRREALERARELVGLAAPRVVGVEHLAGARRAE